MRILDSFTAADGLFAIGHPLFEPGHLNLQVRGSAPIPFESAQGAMKEYIRLSIERGHGLGNFYRAIEAWRSECAMPPPATPVNEGLCSCEDHDCVFSEPSSCEKMN